MMRIYSDVLSVVAALRPVLQRVEQKDSDLGKQMKRALTSVPLNVAEGSASRGGNRAARYHTAAGSMREVIAVVEVSQALGYFNDVDAVLLDRMHKIINTLKKVSL